MSIFSTSKYTNYSIMCDVMEICHRETNRHVMNGIPDKCLTECDLGIYYFDNKLITVICEIRRNPMLLSVD